jgi:hypothetical protein
MLRSAFGTAVAVAEPMKSHERLFRIAAIAALVPAVFVGGLMLPEQPILHLGVGKVLGCSGGGNVPAPIGWTSLTTSLPPDAEHAAVPIATDGFFAIDVEGASLTESAAQSGLRVVVTNEAGEVLAGETTLLETRSPGYSYLFGWSAAEPIAVGSKLRASLSALQPAETGSPQVGGEYALLVVGAPTPLPEPGFTFSSWLDFYHGDEPATLSCAGVLDPSGCGGQTFLVPTLVTKQLAAELSMQLPTVTGGVAWKARLEASPTNGDASFLVYGGEYFGDETQLPALLGRAVFPTVAAQYCVTAVLTDLRTKQETRVERCAPAEAPQGTQTDTWLGSCAQPPSEALNEAWCRIRSSRTPGAVCPAFVGGGGSSAIGGSPAGGSAGSASLGGTPSGGSAAGGQPSGGSPGAGERPGNLGANATSGASPAEKRTSAGCQLSGGSSSSSLSGLVGAGLLLVGWGLRRAAASSGRATTGPTFSG